MIRTILGGLLLAVCAFAQVSGIGNLGCQGLVNNFAAINSSTSSGVFGTISSNSPVPFWFVQLDQTTTLTGGAVTFQLTYDNTNWITVPAGQMFTGAGVPTNPVYTLTASTNQAFLVIMNGASGLRLNLTNAITGTATVTAYYAAVCSLSQFYSGVYNSSLPTLTNGQASSVQLDSKGQQLSDLNYYAGSALGAGSNYGTSPGAVLVPGVNAFVTNTPAVTGSGIFEVAPTTSANTAANPFFSSITDGTNVMGAQANFGTSPGAVKSLNVNASIMSGTTALGAPNTFGTTAPTGNALGVNAALFIGTNPASASAPVPISPTTSANTAANPFFTEISDGTNTASVKAASTQAAATDKSVVVQINPNQPNLSTALNVSIPANSSVDEAQINGVAPLMGNGATGTGSQRVTVASDNSALPAWGHGAIGSAVPAGSTYIGGNGSGNLTGLVTCDNSAAINMSTATTSQIIAISGTGGRTYICSLSLVVGAADNVALISGSGTNCASNQAGLAGGTTAASGWNFSANGGIAEGSGLGMLYKTATTNNEICLVTSAAAQVSGRITYTQF